MKRLFSICILLALGSVPVFSAPTVDLTTSGSMGTIGTGRFYQYVIPTAGGTGLLDPFLRILDATKMVVQGYNIDSNPEFDEVDVDTKALLLSAVPTVDKGGTIYREFVLDITENVGLTNELLSLDDLQLYVSPVSTLTSFDPSLQTFSGGTYNLIYDFGDGDWIKMDSTLAPGSGGTDMIALIPGFEGYDENSYYVYLYSKFGVQGDGSNGLSNSDGFEEWSVSTGAAFIPAPAAIALCGIGIGCVNLLRRRRIF